MVLLPGRQDLTVLQYQGREPNPCAQKSHLRKNKAGEFPNKSQYSTVNIVAAAHAPESPEAPQPNHVGVVLKTLFFKGFNGETLALSDVPSTIRIEDLRNRIKEYARLNPDGLRMLWGGKELQDGKNAFTASDITS